MLSILVSVFHLVLWSLRFGNFMCFIPWSILLGVKIVVILLGIILGVLNLNDGYKNPPVNNIGKILVSFFNSLTEISF